MASSIGSSSIAAPTCASAARTRSSGGTAPVAPFDGRRLPFTDRSWDTVLFCDILHHTERPVELLREAVRVARHSILIKDHSVEGWLARPLRFMDVVGNFPHGLS
jgi:SAM-dependent methyltransferase